TSPPMQDTTVATTNGSMRARVTMHKNVTPRNTAPDEFKAKPRTMLKLELTMRAGWYERTGRADEVIQVGEMDTPKPAQGEVLVRVHASGINPSDYKRRGNAAVAAEFPRVVPHSDGAGVVAAVGTGVSGLREGDRVWTYNAQWQRPFGTAAEFVSLPAHLVRRLPPNTSFVEGACLG